MDFRFVPKNLIMAKNEIAARHTEIEEVILAETDFSLMNMIKRLASLNLKEAEKEALVVTKKELEAIARYLPHNYYKVRMDSLFLIFRLRCNEKLGRKLLYEWQNSYDNKECNEFLCTFVLQNNIFENIMKLNHYSIQQFVSFLSSEYIPISYGKAALSLHNVEFNTLEDRLEYLGIKATSRLAKDCRYLFYVFCTSNDYIRAGEQAILLVLKKYDDILKKKFLQNFLKQLSLEDLKKFNHIEEYFFRFTGENHSDKFVSYFYGFDPALLRKYVDWIHIYIINKIFGNDERSLFWEQYHHELVTKYTYSNSVVMEFNNHVAVEFLGQAMGPLYIYRKEYFEKDVRNLLIMGRCDNAELRKYLLNNTEYEKNAKILGDRKGTRLVHLPNPGWQINFNSVLTRNGITERIL